MGVSEIYPLKPLHLREVWRNEAKNFTPWLADNLPLLGSAVNMDLELVGQEETLGIAGRVDIRAKQTATGDNVVIENQLGKSDHSHCLRLLGYAATANANILIWVAQEFTDYHQSILSWLNESDNIAIYAVEVRAFTVDGRKVVDFRVVVEPTQESAISAPKRKTASTYYAEFYRPVIESLRRGGLLKVGKGGFAGRYRSFQTGYQGVYYSSGFKEGRATASLGMYGDDRQHIYRALAQYQTEIDAKLDGRPEWHVQGHQCWLWLMNDEVSDDPASIPEEVGHWLVENLLKLRDVAQPYLELVMSDIDRPEGMGNDTG